MASILDSVDQRTRLVGQNRLELLTFRLNGRQLYAINVFKIQEVMSLPKLNLLPHSDPTVAGVTHVRDKTIPVIDLSLAIGRRPLPRDEKSNIIITEYNRSVQAFLVGSVDRIVNMNWESIQPPPAAAGYKHYLTAITQLDGELVEIIDVEKVLAQLINFNTTVTDGVIDQALKADAPEMEILLVDDSPVAIDQAKSTMANFNLKVHVEMDR
jgi:two-component system chemotaxis response regulator CheV